LKMQILKTRNINKKKKKNKKKTSLKKEGEE
jgi:hypothetical protein